MPMCAQPHSQGNHMARLPWLYSASWNFTQKSSGCLLVEVKWKVLNDDGGSQTMGYQVAREVTWGWSFTPTIGNPYLWKWNCQWLIFFPFIKQGKKPCFDATVSEGIEWNWRKAGQGDGTRLRSAISALKYRGKSTTCKHYMQRFWHHIFAASFHFTLQDHKPCLPQHYTMSTLSVTCETGTHELACTIHSPSVRSRVCKSNPQVPRNCPTNLKSEKIIQWWSQ